MYCMICYRVLLLEDLQNSEITISDAKTHAHLPRGCCVLMNLFFKGIPFVQINCDIII